MAEAAADELEAFDSDTFSAIDFVNRLFPSGALAGGLQASRLQGAHASLPHAPAEPTLVGVEPLIQKLKLKIRRVDADILNAVRAQSTSGSQAKADLQSAMAAIQARAGASRARSS